MNEQNTKYLYEHFPLLYKDNNVSMQYTACCWGFDFGDGWYEITKELSEKLEKEIQKFIDKNPDFKCHPCAFQMKEKFGFGRFYMTSQTEVMDKYIDEWKDKTCITCEECGKPGELCSDRGWYRTMCPDCVIESNKENNKIFGSPHHYIQCSKLSNED